MVPTGEDDFLDESWDRPEDDLPDDDWNDDDEDDEDEDNTLPCPECGREVYDQADVCPWCGAFIIHSADNPWAGRSWWWIALGLLGIAAVIYVLMHTPF